MTDTKRNRTVDYQPSTATSRSDRDTTLTALHALEEALAGPTPGRLQPWLQQVSAALETLDTALNNQGDTDNETTSLMSEIGRGEPRLLPRIGRLRQEYQDIRVALDSLRQQINPEMHEDEVDAADIRDRLSAIARRYRQHRSREADLVYEAINVDLGAGD